MRQRYIMDDKVILSLQGLRFIKKQDVIYASANSDNNYRLIWNYKGADGYVDYVNKRDRDKIFDEIGENFLKQQDQPKTLIIDQEKGK